MRHAVTHYPLNFFLATTIFLCHTIYFWLIISCYSGQTAQVSPGTVEVKGVLSDTIAARIWKKSQYWLFDRDFFQIPRPGCLIETKNWPWQPWYITVRSIFSEMDLVFSSRKQELLKYFSIFYLLLSSSSSSFFLLPTFIKYWHFIIQVQVLLIIFQ